MSNTKRHFLYTTKPKMLRAKNMKELLQILENDFDLEQPLNAIHRQTIISGLQMGMTLTKAKPKIYDL